MDIDFVLWDHDGVIVDTEPWFFEATRRTLRDLGVEVSQEQWLSCQAMGQGIEKVATASTSARLDFGEIRRVLVEAGYDPGCTSICDCKW